MFLIFVGFLYLQMYPHTFDTKGAFPSFLQFLVYLPKYWRESVQNISPTFLISF